MGRGGPAAAPSTPQEKMSLLRFPASAGRRAWCQNPQGWVAGASACPDLATGARETGREPGDPRRLGRQRGWGNMASPVLFLEDAGEWGHGKKSSVFSQSLMADFRFPRARRGRQQDASPGRVPVLGPLLLHAGLAPSCPHRPRPLLCASPCLPPGPRYRKNWVPYLSQHPTTKTASPRHPAPCTPARRMSPRRAGPPLLCSAHGPAGRAGVLAPTAGLGLAQRGPSPRKRSGVRGLPTSGQREDPRPRGMARPLQPPAGPAEVFLLPTLAHGHLQQGLWVGARLGPGQHHG